MQKTSTRWLAGLLCLALFSAAGCSTLGAKRARMYSSLPPEPLLPPDACASAAMDKTRPAEDGNIEQTTNATDRMIMYDATLHVVVTNADSALAAIMAMASTLGGYMQSLEGTSIILRIPGSHLNDAMRQVEKLGEVSYRQIAGTDITEEMLDLDIRLKNMRETRNRLVTLLDKVAKVEELLAVEKELQRVTEALEVMEGRIKYLSHAVQYSTLTVEVNAPVPQAELQDVIPFPWVRRLASNILLSPDDSYTPNQKFRPWLKMDLPPNCVKLSETRGVTRAMSGSGPMMLIRREDNFQGGSLEFWAPLIRKSLVAEKSIALGDTEQVTLDSGARGLKFIGTKALGRKTYQYIVWIVTTKDHIYSFECWGVVDDVAKIQPQLDKAALSMGIKP